MDSGQEEIGNWIKNIQTIEEESPLGHKYRSFIPLRLGCKPVETHSMLDKNWSYQGELDIFGKPHGHGEVIFSDGETSRGRFVDGLRHGPGVVRVKSDLSRNISGEMTDSRVSFIECNFVADKIEGPGKVGCF